MSCARPRGLRRPPGRRDFRPSGGRSGAAAPPLRPCAPRTAKRRWIPAARAARRGPRRCRARRTGGPGRSCSRALRRKSSCSTVSTPSATTCMPRLRPISMMVRTIVASFASVAASRTKRLVDLQRADRELLQRRQRGIAGAEVVDRQVQAHRVQLVQQLDGALRIGHQRRLGDLELEACPATRRARWNTERQLQDEARLAQLLQRQVERDAARVAALVVQARGSRCRRGSAPTRRCSLIRLFSSASGMNCEGGMSPWPGRRQRSSASAPTMRPSRRSTFGW